MTESAVIRDPATCLAASANALELAELCERKAALLRDMAEALAAEAGRPADEWSREAEHVCGQLERKAQAKAGRPFDPESANRPSYRTDSGVVRVASLAGRLTWTLDDKPIARRHVRDLIAARMKSRLG